MQGVSHNPEPFQLVQRNRMSGRETYGSWFDRTRTTVAPYTTTTTAFSLEPRQPMVVVSQRGELRPASAGAIAGGVGGAVMLAVATLATRLGGAQLDLASMLGHFVTRGALVGTPAFALGVALSVAAGAMIGVLFATVTRRLRQLAPLMVFAILLASSSWLLVHALALPHLLPWLARALSIGPMLVGSAIFGVILSLELALRTRRVV